MLHDECIILTKRWNKDGCGTLEQGVQEIVINRSMTLFEVKNLIAAKSGGPSERVLIAKPFRALLSQLATVLEAIQSVNWDVDQNCIACKSPWYLSNGELIMWKDSSDKEKHVGFLESIYGPIAPPAHRAEPQLTILSKFDRQEIEARKDQAKDVESGKIPEAPERKE